MSRAFGVLACLALIGSSVTGIVAACIDPECVYSSDIAYPGIGDGDHWSLPRAWSDNVFCPSGASGCYTDRDMAYQSPPSVTTLSSAALAFSDCTGQYIPPSAATTGSTSNYTIIASMAQSYCKRRQGM